MKGKVQGIGFVKSCYQEKFGIPRQPGLVDAAPASLVLNEQFDERCVEGLLDFSHLWVTFWFHANTQQTWQARVRPPRLGGNKRVGVFATRSPFRPNPIGLSVVKLLDIVVKDQQVQLKVEGADLLNGTPILDIKPYVPYVDSVADAQGGFAQQSPEQKDVYFSEQSLSQCRLKTQQLNVDIRLLVEQILQQDPRPSYHNQPQREYAMRLYDFDLRWTYSERGIEVIQLTDLAE